MKATQKINAAIITAAAGMLNAAYPELTASTLLKALESYDPARENDIRNTERPLKRKEAAAILGVSMPTINRMLNAGTLRRIHISGAVRIDPATVRKVLAPSPAPEAQR